jgi:DNA primase large subunit
VLIVNPFSAEADRIVKRYKVEEISSKGVFNHAKKMVGWNARQGRKKIVPRELLAGYNEEKDLLAQRLLFLTVSLNFTPYSNELRLVTESIRDLVRRRLLSFLDPTYEEDAIRLLSDRLNIKRGKPNSSGGMKFNGVSIDKKGLYSKGRLKSGKLPEIKYAVDWRDIIKIIRSRKLRFTDLYLVKGLALLNLSDLISYYSILTSIEVEDFINNRFEEFRARRKSGEIQKLITETAELANYLSSVSEESYASSILQGKAAKLRKDNFPPCISSIIAGVETGSRNYAISVLLTSFLSYARAAPRKVQDPRILDYVSDPRVLTDEILPLIYEAASRCSPPLFEDQPMEKMNVHYHLGLGLSSQVKLENSGNSSWYFPPNCEKIRRESPGLCRPDETCAQIKNPLTYYFSKFRKDAPEEKEES